MSVPSDPEERKHTPRETISSWPANFPPIAAHTNIHKLKAHPQYKAAKSGNIISASAVVFGVLNRKVMSQLEEECAGAIVASVHAWEADGINQLPLAYAYAFETWCGMKIETDLIQINRPCHTGKTAIARLLAKPEFHGYIKAGQKYLLVDDVATSGSTFCALRAYIEGRGGVVVACSALALTSSPQCGWSGHLAPTSDTLKKLEARVDIEDIRVILSTHEAQELKDMSNSQLRYILSFKSADSLRDRLSEQE